MEAAIAASALHMKYGTATVAAGAASVLDERTQAAEQAATVEAERARAADEAERLEKDLKRSKTTTSTGTRRRKSTRMSPLEKAIGEASRTAARELVKAIFKKKR